MSKKQVFVVAGDEVGEERVSDSIFNTGDLVVLDVAERCGSAYLYADGREPESDARYLSDARVTAITDLYVYHSPKMPEALRDIVAEAEVGDLVVDEEGTVYHVSEVDRDDEHLPLYLRKAGTPAENSLWYLSDWKLDTYVPLVKLYKGS